MDTASFLVNMLPPGMGLAAFLMLALASLLTSLFTAAMGLGGGVMMLAMIASLLPPAAIIPVHAVVQIGSNLGRAAIMRAHVRREFVLPFLLGTIIGAFAGAMVVVELPGAVLRLILGLFILWVVWAPRLPTTTLPAQGFVIVGAVTTFLTMFVGATGPFIAAFIHPKRLPKLDTVATHAACMTLQHTLKAIAFGALGFVFWPWLPLLAAMIAAGLLGTLIGRRVLQRQPDKHFALSFNIILTILALVLLWNAIGDLAGAGRRSDIEGRTL